MLPCKRLHTACLSGAARAPRRQGFTLVELLVVMGILASLAAILVPIINSGRRIAKIAATKNLIMQTELAIDRFNEDHGYYPPDKIPASAQIKKFSADEYMALAQATSSSTEALYYCLGNPYATPFSPYLELQAGKETADANDNKLPEIVDRWGRALEYHRNPFPTGAAMPLVFVETGGAPSDLSNYDDNVAPSQNTGSYDLWSLGPTGQVLGQTIGNWK